MSRRNPGEGSISQRPDGRWQASLQVNGARKVVYGKTEKEARKKLQEVQRQLAVSHSLPTAGRRTVSDLLDFWLDTVKDTLKPRTLSDYQRVGDQLIKPQIGQIRLSQLEPGHVQALYNRLATKGSKRRAFYVHQTLHRALNLAVMWNWIPSNPAARVIKPSYRAERKDLWTHDELSLFLEAIQGHWLAPLWIVTLSTGCRLGELLALPWDCVDLTGRTIRICRAVQRIGREWVETTPKTRAGERTIALPGEAVEALRHHRAVQAELRLKAGPAWQRQDLVFTGELGRILFHSTPERAMRRLCESIGIKPQTPHGLRHLHASLLLAKGLPITAVSQRLGHANAAITMSVYAHALRKQDDEAAMAIQAVLGSL